MPSPFYSTSGLIGLRKLLGTSTVHDISTGFAALGADVEAHLLGFVAHAASVTAAPGELLKMSATATVTLPAASNNAIVGVFCAGGETTIKAPSGIKIYGDFVNGAESIKLVLNQRVVLQADGTNWFIIAGIPAPPVVGAPGTQGPNIASWGLIGSSGEILAGSGDYTVSNPSEGKYIITWKVAKASANYAVVATAASTAGGAGAIPVPVAPVVSTKEFVVELYTPGGAHVSDKFSFVALAAS